MSGDPVRVAFVGKGGSGKSAIAGTFARGLARRGHSVLAIDVDHVPGLAFSLGIDVDDATIPDEATVPKPDGEPGFPFRLAPGLTGAEAAERYSVRGPDGVRFLQFGNLAGDNFGDIVRSLCAFRAILDDVPSTGWSLVGDLPAGTQIPYMGMIDYAQTVIAVVEPTVKSLMTVRRLGNLANLGRAPERMVAVASKVRTEMDVAMIKARCGLEVVGAVPWDEALASAEKRRQAPIDAAPLSPAVRAVDSLVELIIDDDKEAA